MKLSVFGLNAPLGEVSLRISDPTVFRVPIRSLSPAKRLIDLFVCFLTAPIALLISLPIAFFLKLDGGRILYAQPRVGANGHIFPCLKFRSMVLYQKLSDDPRVTWFGRVLRAYSLDELPQFINVLRGEMSVVGPRPIMVDQIELYGEQFGTYCAMRPGITGLWQVSGRNERTFAERVRLDSHYVNTWSIAGDLKIMLLTLPAVLAGRGAK